MESKTGELSLKMYSTQLDYDGKVGANTERKADERLFQTEIIENYRTYKKYVNIPTNQLTTEFLTTDRHLCENLQHCGVIPYMDLEWYGDDPDPTKTVLGIYEYAKENSNGSIQGASVFCASRNTKIKNKGIVMKHSYHLHFVCRDNWVCGNTTQLGEWIKMLNCPDMYPTDLLRPNTADNNHSIIDDNPYSKNQLLRMPYQSKITDGNSLFKEIRINGIPSPDIPILLLGFPDKYVEPIEPTKKEVKEISPLTTKGAVDITRVLNGLNEKRVNDYTYWLNAGFALKNGGYSCEVWDEWSKKGRSYKYGVCEKAWRGFGSKEKTITVATLFYWLKEDNPELFQQIRDEKKVKKEEADEEEYLAMKEEFEKDHFFVKSINVICLERENRPLMYFPNKNLDCVFAEYHIEGKKTFISKWIQDKDKRAYLEIVNKIDVSKLVEGEYNLYKGLLGSKAKGENPRGLERFLELCMLLGSMDENKRDYVLNWFALLIQKPHIIPRTCLVVMGKQGAGKETVVDYIGNKIVGCNMYANMKSGEDLYGNYSQALEGTVLHKLEEATSLDNKKNADKLKGFITRTKDKINPKGIRPYDLDVYPHFVMTTNNPSPVKIEDNDRRFVMLYMNGSKIGDIPFWNETHSLLEQEGTVASIFKYLMERDISSFNTSAIPISVLKEALKEAEKCPVRDFVEKNVFEEKGSVDLYKQYCEWLRSLETHEEPMRSRQFYNLLPRLAEEGLMNVRVVHKTFIYTKKGG